MTDFTPLLRHGARRGFSGGVAEPDQSGATAAENEVITPIRGLEGVRTVHLADHSARVPRNLFAAPPQPVEAAPAPAPPPGPTEAEIQARIDGAVAEVRDQAAAELAAARAEIDAVKETLAAMADALDARRAALSAEARAAAGGLVLQAIERISGELPEALEGLLRSRVNNAAESLVGSSAVVLRVRPDDLALATELVGDRSGWRVEADASVTGGCLAISEAGTIDGSLEAALTGIRSAAASWRAEVGAGEGT